VHQSNHKADLSASLSAYLA